ncbi:MAG: 16S rRNA (guanine(527)-N(7))-methyltransferase RsmG [Lachnospiraceae bacterium]
MKELLYNNAKKAGINLSSIHLEKFQVYFDLMLETNKVINLTAITEKKDIVNKHFIDSIALKNYINLDGRKIIDIGTGAGFPGIPLAIISDNAHFTLVDSLNKRIKFLDKIIKECGLNNVETVHSRAEDLGHNETYREKYDYCVSRAVANMSVLLEYCIPFVKTGGQFISYKSEKAEDEIKQTTNAQNKLGCKFIKSYSFNLPETDISRRFYIFERNKKLSKTYPRQAGKPKKNPL